MRCGTPNAQQQTRLNAPAGPRGLLMDGLPGGATDRFRAGLGKIAEITGVYPSSGAPVDLG